MVNGRSAPISPEPSAVESTSSSSVQIASSVGAATSNVYVAVPEKFPALSFDLAYNVTGPDEVGV